MYAVTPGSGIHQADEILHVGILEYLAGLQGGHDPMSAGGGHLAHVVLNVVSCDFG